MTVQSDQKGFFFENTEKKVRKSHCICGKNADVADDKDVDDYDDTFI